MKKILKFLSFAAVAIIGVKAVNAQEVNLNDLKPNTYIIGERIFELNSYRLSLYDIIQAQAEYSEKHGSLAPIYYYGKDIITGEQYIKVTTGSTTEERKTVDEVFPNGKVEASAKNNEPLNRSETLTNYEDIIKGAVAELNGTNNANANSYGFKSISYANKTITFEIDDLTKKLADYKQSDIVNLFLNNNKNVKSITYTIDNNSTTITKDKMNETSEVIKLAKTILSSLSVDGGLTYRSVAGKSVSAKVTYEEYGLTYTDTYTLEFTYDMTKLTNTLENDITFAVDALSKESVLKTTGFSTVVKNEKIITYTIDDLDGKLADYKNSSIVTLAQAAVENATTVEFKIDNTTVKTVDVKNDDMNTSALMNMAKELLLALSGSQSLTLRDVANKTLTANITFKVGALKETVSYSLVFYYDLNTYFTNIDNKISNNLSNLNKETELTTAGFSMLTYNSSGTRKLSFEINNLDGKLADYKNSSILDVISVAIEDGVTINFAIGNTYIKTVNVSEDINSSGDLVKLAKELLLALSGSNGLTTRDVANKTLIAEVKYKLGNEELEQGFFLEFSYDMVAQKDANIDNGIKKLTLTDTGFRSVAYDNLSKTVTFKIEDGTKQLSAFQNSGIVDLFLNNIDCATKIEYTLNEQKTINLPNDANEKSEVIALAKEILAYLAGDAGLTLDAVNGESISAKVYYELNGLKQDATYTIAFTK